MRPCSVGLAMISCAVHRHLPACRAAFWLASEPTRASSRLHSPGTRPTYQKCTDDCYQHLVAGTGAH